LVKTDKINNQACSANRICKNFTIKSCIL